MSGSDFFSDMPMLDLFRMEVEQQGATLLNELIKLENDTPELAENLATLMRAAHSIKGAARLVNRNSIVDLAHVLEDCFVQSQKDLLTFSSDQVDVLLAAVDVLHSMAKDAETDDEWMQLHKAQYDSSIDSLRALYTQLSSRSVQQGEGQSSDVLSVDDIFPDLSERETPTDTQRVEYGDEETPVFCAIEDKQEESARAKAVLNQERVLRVSSRHLDHLMSLTGEFMVQSRWLRPYTDSLRRLKREQAELVSGIEELKEKLRSVKGGEAVLETVLDVQQRAVSCRDEVDSRVVDLEAYDVRGESLSSRLRSQVISTRMRPFRDGVHGMPRIVRDVARSLGKDIELEMTGLETLVDRDILERIEAPLSHLINNAIDHGIESPQVRQNQGKPIKGTIKLSAFHHGGMLYITVEDDGKGIDFESLRQKVVKKGFVKEGVVDNLSQQELGAFMFLPGFSTKEEVTSLSGRGVGLDIVQDVVQEMRGAIEVSSQLGLGTQFKARFPLTLSIVPSLLVEISGEPYAFPLARVDKIIRVDQSEVIEQEGQRFIRVDEEPLILVDTAEILELDEQAKTTLRTLSILVLSSRDHTFGYVVDRFLKESELVVHVLPSQIERIQDIAAIALMDDGTPVFILDVDDLLRSTTKAQQMSSMTPSMRNVSGAGKNKKRILVVDDSITVRELERKLLVGAGYDVEVAVDGMDGWNAVRNNIFDLVVTDVDMPRLNGLQLLNMIKQDSGLKSIPVIVVSYKDRPEDQQRALSLGADLFIAKANFHDETFKESVGNLIAREHGE